MIIRRCATGTRSCMKDDDVRAQLIAADAMRYAFYSPFLVMVKHDNTDVLTIGPYIRRAHQFLDDISSNAESASAILHGNQVLFDGQFRENFTKPVGLSTYGEELMDLTQKYLRAGCKTAAEGLRSISREYFPDGQYIQPTEHMTSVLSGMEGHTDRNEGNFGQFSQQLRREPNACLQTVNSKVVMRANNTVEETRQNPVLASVVSKTRKLEHNESSITIRQQLAEVSRANEPHLQRMRATVARRQEKRAEKSQIITRQIELDGEMRKVRDVDLLSKKYTTKQSELKDILKRHINFLKAEHPELVSDNKGLFMFSKDKKVLSTSDLIQNLKAIVLLLPVSDTVPDVPSSDDESSVLKTMKILMRTMKWRMRKILQMNFQQTFLLI